MENAKLVSSVLVTTLALAASVAAAADSVLRTEGIRHVDVITKHLYKVKIYEPPQPLDVKPTANDPVITLLSKHFQAMRTGHVGDFLATWEDESARDIKKRQATESRDAIAKRWVDMLRNRNVVLVARYEYQHYELAEYRIQDANGRTVFSDVLALTDRSLSPNLTLRLKDSPVLRAIREKVNRVDDIVGLQN